MLPNASKYGCFSYPPGSAHVAAGISESADPGWPGVLGVGGGGEGFQSLGISKLRGGLKLKLGAGVAD